MFNSAKQQIEMNAFSDAVTIGVVITLVFGALFFYLYSRQVQNEKRVSLIENILLDLKMSADANQSWATANWSSSQQDEDAKEESSNHTHEVVNNVVAPEPLTSDDIDKEELPSAVKEEENYKNLLDKIVEDMEPSLATGPTKGAHSAKVQPNYAAMTTKELKSLAKQRGLTFPSGAGRKEITEGLRKQDGTGVQEPVGYLEPQHEGGLLVEGDSEQL